MAAEKDKIEEEMDRQISQKTDRLTNNMPGEEEKETEKKKKREKMKKMNKIEIEQVTRGHNIVADGWAGVSNPHPTFPTCTEPFKTLVFPFFDSCSRTNGQTDRPTDRQSLLLIMELRGNGIL